MQVDSIASAKDRNSPLNRVGICNVTDMLIRMESKSQKHVPN
jgi:hypothetical protein